MAFTKVAPAGIGSTPGDGYRIGDSFLHSTGVDITNINATGIVTAASLDISGAIDFDGHTELDNVNISGVSTFAGNIDANGDLDVDGHTNLDNVSIAGVTTFADNKAAYFGTDGDFHINHSGSSLGMLNTTGDSLFRNTGGSLYFDCNQISLRITAGSQTMLNAAPSGVTLYTSNSSKLATTNNGVSLPQDLDVDGHTNLDNVSIVGVTTITANNVIGLNVENSSGSGAQTTIRSKSTVANASNFVRSESSDNKYIGLLKYGTGHSAYGALAAGGGAVYANSSVPITIMSDGGYINFATGGNTERLRITSDGDVSISSDGTVHGISKLTVLPANRTTAFSASDGDTWHDVVLKQTGSATNNAVGIAFETSTSAYHKNAGTGIAAVKNGTNSDYGSDLVFITRPQSAVAAERLRITSTGKVGINDNNPDSQLVVKPVSGHSTAKVTSGDGNTTMVMQAVQGSEGRLGMTSNHSLAIYSGGLEKLRINTNGNFTFYNSAAAWNTIQRATATHYIGLRIQEGDGTQRMQFGVAGTAGHIITGSAQHDVCLKAYDANLLLATNATERLRIASNGNVSIGNNPTVHSDTIFHVEKSSGETNVKFEGNDTMGARLQLHNNSTSGSAKNQIDFCDAGGQSTSSIQGFNTDQTNNLGELVFATRSAQGSPPEERLRIKSTGEIHISDRNSSNTGDHFFQAGAFGIRMEDTGGYNRWNIERNYGGYQSTPIIHLSAQGRVGINQSDPGGSGLDITTSRTTNFSTTSDQRSLANLVLRQSSDAPNRFVSLSFVNGGGTQAEASINLMQTANYEGDFRFKFRSGGGSNDWRQRFNFKSNGLLGVNCNPNRSIHVSQEYQGTSGVAAFENNNSNNSSAITFMSTLRDGNSGESFLQCNRDQDNNGQGVKAVFFIRTNGDCDSDTNSYGGISDIKLKENIVDAKSQWDDIKNIKVRNFNFKDNPSQKMLGVVAQEVETVSAGLVKDCPDENLTSPGPEGTSTKSVKYSILYMKAIKALQEAQARIETLEAKVSALEGS